MADEQCEQLAIALADELVYLVPTIGLSTTLRGGQRGPKAKTAQVVLIAQVHAILQRFDIAPKEWAWGARRETQLTDWCRKLLKEAGIRGLQFSDRQRRAAKLTKAQKVISPKLDHPRE